MTDHDAVDDAETIALLRQLPAPTIPRPVSDDIVAALRTEQTPLATVTPIARQRRPLAPLLLAGAAGVVGLLVAGTVLPSSGARPVVTASTMQAGGIYSPATLSNDVRTHMAAGGTAPGQSPPTSIRATTQDVDACADRMAILAPVEFVDFGTYQSQPVAIIVTRYILDPQYIHIWVVSAACDRIVDQSVARGSV